MSFKDQLKTYWEREPCDFRLGKAKDPFLFFEEIARKRYELEPFIPDLVNFSQGKGRRVLEVGIGLGVDFLQWIKNDAWAVGVDLTSQAIRLSRDHLDGRGVSREAYRIFQADAETLPFKDHSFDLVYSWGVLHHTFKTELAIQEAFRVLSPGGVLKAMVYHVPSWTGWLLWLRFGLLAGKPFFRVKDLIYRHLESPGTKAFTCQEMAGVLSKTGFAQVITKVTLGSGDLLSMELSSKYRSLVYQIVQALYPRWLVKALGDRYGLFLFLEATKPHLA
jgi:ubiquinone/menaquinone biosynthesis C-methylase UbiE